MAQDPLRACAQSQMQIKSHMKTTLLGRNLAPAIMAVSFAAAGASHAAATAGNSNAYGVGGNVTATLVIPISLTIANTPTVTGTAPAPYTNANQAASVNLSTLGLAGVETGIINVSAISNVDGAGGVRASTASAVVNGLDLGVLGSILSITANTITSTSTVTGDVSAPVGTSSSIITGLTVNAFGAAVPVTAEALATPNFVLLDLAGLRIVLNESIISPGATTASATTNAIHVSLNNVVGIGGLTGVSGDIIVGHSFAQQSIPEPAALTLSLGALGLLMFRKRRDA